jgi:ATP-dependent DNA helicase RecQ
MKGILSDYTTERTRVIAALEYFNQMGWIELTTKNAVDVYDIINAAFDTDSLTRKMYQLFTSKENIEINRIHEMVAFFESNTCLSRKLADYFGEKIEQPQCGHCAYCTNRKAEITSTNRLGPITQFEFAASSNEFKATIKEDFTAINLTKFLCGIYTPVFTKNKIKTLPQFGSMGDYPFHQVKQWVEENIQSG